jgi:mono/diheme cytochrome c family protein
MTEGKALWRTTGVALAALGLLALVDRSPVQAEESPNTQITFTKHVARIFQERCEVCHRPDSIGPMPLRSYEEVRPWARAIKERVLSRQMPPWHLDKTVGIQKYKNDRSLSDEEIDTIVRWVDAGAPRGDPRDMPPPKQWPDESVWNFASLFGPPDLIIKSPPYTVKAGSQDAWWKPVVETGLTEPRWVRAIEIRPATVPGRRVTHHALAHLIQQEPGVASRSSSSDDPASAGLFMEWAVGKQGELMRPDAGKLMLPGSKIRFDIHTSAATLQPGEEITDHVELGIYFYPKGQEPKFRQVLRLWSSIAGGSRNIDIPPNSIWVSQNVHVLRQNGRIENFQPHMHLRGKAMLLEAIYPDGRTEVLSYVSNYNFNWHVNYVYDDDVAPLLPKGSMLRLTAWYDNTAANKNNPDPNQWVGDGDRTVDEMGHAWINVTYMDDESFQAELAKRKARQQTTTAALQQP